jgi:PelA/Pel-15E family pectate lyase
MYSQVRSSRIRRLLVLTIVVLAAVPTFGDASGQSREQVLAAMKRATEFMVDKVAYRGGYVWNYLPDKSRRWGEMEARESMIWIQPPGTPTMGHLFLDALHATGDTYYYEAAAAVAGALMAAQHPSGGWNYMADFGGEQSLREWYGTIGKNAWRLEEFQHYWGNATFDDAGTAEASKFLLRMYAEKRDPKYKPALDRAIQFVLDAQYPAGFWPQRYPRAAEHSTHGKPDYTALPTFNDDVAAENIDFLVMAYQVLGDPRLLDPITRGMDAFRAAQQPAPQAGWGLQHALGLKPVGARTYEPDALVTHTTARNVELLMDFYRLTGDASYLARVPEALDWLESVRSPAGVAPAGRTHPTFVEIGSNKPLYVHRTGSNVVNGRYFVDRDPTNTIGHYSAFRTIDVAALRRQLAEVKAMTPEEATKNSPLRPNAERLPLKRYFAAAGPTGGVTASALVSSLNEQGYWLAPLGYNSHPYKGDGPKTVQPGDFSRTHVGDSSDTSPYPDPSLMGISVEAYVRNMGALIHALAGRGEMRHGLRDTENAPSLTETQRETGAFPLSAPPGATRLCASQPVGLLQRAAGRASVAGR